jgi:hypothetical protein
MTYDYGFELPDTRYTFYSNGERVAVKIVRQWYQDDFEDDEPRFKCSFEIVRARETTHLPTGCDESKAIDIARQLYPQTEEDIEDTNSEREYEAECAAERRMGA